jgi:SH3-like domain-containing protein
MAEQITITKEINKQNPARNTLQAGFLLFLLLSLSQPPQAHCANRLIEKNYFASLRASETNVRAGPGSNYAIKFTFKMRGLPVKVISEYDNWSEIKDYEGDTGWINQNLITKKRMVMIRTAKSFVNMHSKTSIKSKIILRMENKVIGEFIKCSNDWCGVKISGEKGWVEKSDLWGVDKND